MHGSENVQRRKQPTRCNRFFVLLIFLNQPNMFRATNSPIFRGSFWLCVQILVYCTAPAADRCHRLLGGAAICADWSARNCIGTRLQQHRFMRHLVYNVRYFSVPVNFSLFTVTLYCSVTTTHNMQSLVCRHNRVLLYLDYRNWAVFVSTATWWFWLLSMLRNLA